MLPEFRAVTLTNNALSLTWTTEAGGSYQLQYTSDLNSSNWTNLGSPLTATEAALSTTDSVTNGPRPKTGRRSICGRVHADIRIIVLRIIEWFDSGRPLFEIDLLTRRRAELVNN
jgi:hypothetical protein